MMAVVVWRAWTLTKPKRMPASETSSLRRSVRSTNSVGRSVVIRTFVWRQVELGASVSIDSPPGNRGRGPAAGMYTRKHRWFLRWSLERRGGVAGDVGEERPNHEDDLIFWVLFFLSFAIF